MGRANEPVMPEPVAYLLTWATYGTWLPGDERGWVERGKGVRSASPIRHHDAKARMSEDAFLLDDSQRTVVHETIVEHCRIRGWRLYAVNCRSNHVHVVVAADREPDEIVRQFKAWCTRRLKELEVQRQASGGVPSLALRAGIMETSRKRWWGERSSTRFINDEASLEDAVGYVVDGQDMPR